MIQLIKNLNLLQNNGMSQSNRKSKYNQNNSIKCETKSIRSSLFDCYDAFILATGDITVTANSDTHITFKDRAPFSIFQTKFNDVFIDQANHTYILIPVYNLIEYSDDYSLTSVSLQQF